jgi:AraC family transcriptional regulator, transcriptional activator FtrA
VLQFCHQSTISASGRKDKEHQKTAMPTIAVLIYDAVNPFELGVATEVFGFEHSIGMLIIRYTESTW